MFDLGSLLCVVVQTLRLWRFCTAKIHNRYYVESYTRSMNTVKWHITDEMHFLRDNETDKWETWSMIREERLYNTITQILCSETHGHENPTCKPVESVLTDWETGKFHSARSRRVAADLHCWKSLLLLECLSHYIASEMATDPTQIDTKDVILHEQIRFYREKIDEIISRTETTLPKNYSFEGIKMYSGLKVFLTGITGE